MKLNFFTYPKNPNDFSANIKDAISSFKNSERYDFINTLKDKSLLQQCQDVFKWFEKKKYFVQIGIGGSSLGPEMLVKAMNKRNVKFTFLNNIDTDYTIDQLEQINLKESLFYVVSKSGGTAETMAQMAIVINELRHIGVKDEELKNYFVFATDPIKSELKDLGEEFDIETLVVPTNVGGRFSVLTPVGLLPALFAGYDCTKLLASAHEFATSYIDSDEFIKVSNEVLSLYEEGVNQTVVMPYSSKLRDFSFWFVQLWAESLGKKRGAERIGLTPIPAYGATDQHSQVQLFMEGPKDKLIFMINIKNVAGHLSLENNFKNSKLEILDRYSLKNLMDAEFFGTLKALQEQGQHHIQIELEDISEASLGKLILFFEMLTATVGICLKIDPFDQPGVEAGKVFSFEWLNHAL